MRLALAVLLLSFGCTELKPPHDRATAEDARAPEDARLGADVRPGSDAAPGDTPGADAEAVEAGGTDAEGLEAGAPDQGVPCVPQAGQLCDRPGLCGARVACDGTCQGGSAAPTCPCGPAQCAQGNWVCTGNCCVPETGTSCARAGFCGAVVDCDGSCIGGAAPPACQCATPVCDVPGATWSACPDPNGLGQACDTQNRCGAVLDCSGTCSGGTPPPVCPCGAATCDTSRGTWSSCPGAPNVGQSCDTANRCGAAIACDGSCQGGTTRPACACNTPTCLNGQWSPCSDPSDYGQSCDRDGRCGGSVACSGQCTGGAPLPSCPECGTPTCGGCAGGTCGANSLCSLAGTCSCVIDTCDCGGPGQCTSCDLAGAALGTCDQDAYGCGLHTLTQLCTFGCGGMTPACLCSPDFGNYCEAGTCFCSCGDVPRDGEYNCQGVCLPTLGCPAICRDLCGGT